MDKQDLNGDKLRSEYQDTGGEQSPEREARRPDANDHGDRMSPSSDPNDGLLSNSGELCEEPGTSTDESNGVYSDNAGGPEPLCNSHSWHRGEDSTRIEDTHMPPVKDSDQGNGQNRGTEGGDGEPFLNQRDQATYLNTDGLRDMQITACIQRF